MGLADAYHISDLQLTHREEIRMARKRKCNTDVVEYIVPEKAKESLESAKEYLRQLAKRSCEGDGILAVRIDSSESSSYSVNGAVADAGVDTFDGFAEGIRVAWNFVVVGFPAYQVARKLARVRTTTKKWALDKKDEWRKVWDDFEKKLKEGINVDVTGRGDEVYTRANEEVKAFASANAILWKQRAKMRWIVDGDTCTKFYFNWLKGRKGRNYIHGLKGDNGDVVEWRTVASFDWILAHVKRSVSNDDADHLIKPFTAKEVSGAVFQMRAFKPPGPDDIPACFFQKCWPLVKKEVTKAVLSILNSGRVLRELNRTFITLIPKTDNPGGVSDYRPISLCNVFMRIVSKCITNRVAKVMGSLVSEAQNAFIPGRHISDNILLAHKTIHRILSHKKGKYGRCVFKADMSKAYDRIKWDFLEAVLIRFGFPQRLVHLIMNYVTTVSYKVLFNGSPLPRFQPRCGLRQGDPLSPYLFILCMEVLGGQIEFAKEDKGQAAVNLKRIMDDYCDASGQKLNLDKSGILFSPSTTLTKVQEIISVLRLRSTNGIGKYLGIPAEFQESKKGIFYYLLDYVTTRISSWNGIFLSPAGNRPKYGVGYSWGVKSIIYGMELILENIGWKPGLESCLNVWNAKWVNGATPEPKDRFLDFAFLFLGSLQVCELWNRDLTWNAPLVRAFFKENDAEWIMATTLCKSWKYNEVFWPLTNDEVYSVKSGYGIAFMEHFEKRGTIKDKSRITMTGRGFCKSRLWSLPGPNLWKILIWKIVTNTLPVGFEFQKRQIEGNHTCRMCLGDQLYSETMEHIFRDCGLASRVWAGSELRIRVEGAAMIPLSDWIINWLRYLETLEEGEMRVLVFLAMLWGLWITRNNAVFKGNWVMSRLLLQFVANNVEVCLQSMLKEKEYNEKVQRQDGHPVYMVGRRGQCRGIRVKVDAGWLKNFDAAIGWVAYNGYGVMIESGSRKIATESALHAEALGISEVIHWAVGKGFLHLEVVTDCLPLICQIAGYAGVNHVIKGMLQDFKSLYACFHCLSFSYIARNLNSVAHGLASRAMRL
ncbi:uncharacterized protein LOC141600665 [Silene latifolia]|uniref:uncharacterized protein LOC141600665 n=1 Tax=Silene latifolia TaxID=37657 RepID=UPI003D77C992